MTEKNHTPESPVAETAELQDPWAGYQPLKDEDGNDVFHIPTIAELKELKKNNKVMPFDVGPVCVDFGLDSKGKVKFEVSMKPTEPDMTVVENLHAMEAKVAELTEALAKAGTKPVFKMKKVIDAKKTSGLLVAYLFFEYNGTRYYDWHLLRTKMQPTEKNYKPYWVATPRFHNGSNDKDYPSMLFAKEEFAQLGKMILESTEVQAFLKEYESKPRQDTQFHTPARTSAEVEKLKAVLTPEFVLDVQTALFGTVKVFKDKPIVEVFGAMGKDPKLSNVLRKTTYGEYDFLTQNKAKDSSYAARARAGAKLIWVTAKATIAGKEKPVYLALLADGKIEKYC